MSKLERQMQEDRAMRDAAKALVDADLAHVKNSFSGPGLTERAATNLSEGARDVFEKASDAAESHKGILAALVGAVIIWFARNPLLSLLETEDEDDNGAASGVDGSATTQSSELSENAQ